MNNKINNNKSKSISTTDKVIVSLCVFSISLVIYCIIQFIYLDNKFTILIMNVSFVILTILLFFMIWYKKHKKIIIISILFTIFVLIGNFVYYENYATKIESLIYLHKKYDIPYSKMKTIKITKGQRGDFFGHDSVLRSAIIKYKEFNIYVYYLNGWKDDYKQEIKFNKINKQITKKFNSIMGSYTNDFKIIENTKLDEGIEIVNKYTFYGYVIYLYNSDDIVVSDVIAALDDYVANNDTSYIYYDLFIIKNKDFYDELIKVDINSLNSDGYGQQIAEASNILEKKGYDGERSKLGFEYDKIDKQLQNSEHIVFVYSVDRNSFVGVNEPELWIYHKHDDKKTIDCFECGKYLS